MPENKPLIDNETQEKLAKNLFNQVWDLIDKEIRTVEENDAMLNAAHASRHHWAAVGTSLQIERGEWQISRVYSVLGRAEPALYHARRCMEICEANGIGDFDIAFAYEALARAYSVSRETAKSKENISLAKNAAEHIQEKDDREYFESELATVESAS